MNSEKRSYFLTILDIHIKNHEDVLEALVKTLEDYRFVFYGGPEHEQFQRAAQRTLERMKNEDD